MKTLTAQLSGAFPIERRDRDRGLFTPEHWNSMRADEREDIAVKLSLKKKLETRAANLMGEKSLLDGPVFNLRLGQQATTGGGVPFFFKGIFFR